MLNFDSELRRRLLADVRLARDPKQLHVQKDLHVASAVLDDYEELVGQSFVLRRAGRELNVSDNVLRRLQVALEIVNARITQVLSVNIPDFYEIHSAWSSKRRAIEIGAANRAYTKWYEPTRSPKGGISPVVRFLGAIVLLLFSGVIALLPVGKEPGDIGTRPLDPERIVGYVFNDVEQGIWSQWQELENAGRQDSLQSFTATHRLLLHLIGQKLLAKSVLWWEMKDSTRAQQNLHQGEQLGSVLVTVSGDSSLVHRAWQIRQAYLPEK
jgi:hypothetical protein